jgi:hypothetical protein
MCYCLNERIVIVITEFFLFSFDDSLVPISNNVMCSI